MKNLKLPYFIFIIIFLTACGGGADQKDDDYVKRENPFEIFASEITPSDNGFYFVVDQDAYLVKNSDFNQIYCVGFAPESGGYLAAPQGLYLSLLDDGYLFTSGGEVFKGNELVAQYNLEEQTQHGQFYRASLDATFLVDMRYWQGATYSKDGYSWQVLYADNDEVSSSMRKMLDVQYIPQSETIVGLFENTLAEVFLAIKHNGEWTIIDEQTDIRRLLFFKGKLLAFGDTTISSLDLNTFLPKEQLETGQNWHVSIDEDKLVLAGKDENKVFDSQNFTIQTYQVDEKVGLVTSVAYTHEGKLLGTNKGIWLEQQTGEYKNVFEFNTLITQGCTINNINSI